MLYWATDFFQPCGSVADSTENFTLDTDDDSSDDDDSSVDCSLFGEQDTTVEGDIKTLKSQMNENSQKLDFIQDGLLQSMTFDINAIRSSVMSLKQHDDNP